MNNPRLTIPKLFTTFASVKLTTGITGIQNFMAAKSTEKSADKANVETKAAPAHARELEAAISSIHKSYGDGAIMRLGDAQSKVKIGIIPTGALALDLRSEEHTSELQSRSDLV